MIRLSNFETIYPIWGKELWSYRTSPIESTSAMTYLGNYDVRNMTYIPSFFVYEYEGTIQGVNSGHKCNDGSYRSRGLYVYPEYRKKGIGKKLLEASIDQAKKEECTFIWSYPRQSSWKVYESAGFILSSKWETSETGVNAYCMRKI